MTLIAVEVEVLALCPRPTASQDGDDYALSARRAGPSPDLSPGARAATKLATFAVSRLALAWQSSRAPRGGGSPASPWRGRGPTDEGPDWPQRIAARRPSVPPARRRRALTLCARCPAIPDGTSTRPAPPPASTRSSRSAGRGTQARLYDPGSVRTFAHREPRTYRSGR